MADAHLDHHFFQITTPRLGARQSLGSLAHLEGDRLTEASLKLLFTSMLTADGKETDYGGWYVGRDSLGHEVVVLAMCVNLGGTREVGVTLGPVWQAIPEIFDSATARSAIDAKTGR